MATPTPADIKTRYPAFAAVADATIQLAITDAVPWFDVCRWDTFYAQGFAAFVAHMLTADQAAALGKATGAGGALASKKVGEVEVRYQPIATMKPSDAFFATTIYGQRYLQLRKLVGAGAVAV